MKIQRVPFGQKKARHSIAAIAILIVLPAFCAKSIAYDGPQFQTFDSCGSEGCTSGCGDEFLTGPTRGSIYQPSEPPLQDCETPFIQQPCAPEASPSTPATPDYTAPFNQPQAATTPSVFSGGVEGTLALRALPRAMHLVILTGPCHEPSSDCDSTPGSTTNDRTERNSSMLSAVAPADPALGQLQWPSMEAWIIKTFAVTWKSRPAVDSPSSAKCLCDFCRPHRRPALDLPWGIPEMPQVFPIWKRDSSMLSFATPTAPLPFS